MTVAKSAHQDRIYRCEVRVLKKNPETKENYYDWKVVPVRAAIEDNVAKADV